MGELKLSKKTFRLAKEKEGEFMRRGFFFAAYIGLPVQKVIFYADNSFKVSKGKGKGSIITKHGISFTTGWA